MFLNLKENLESKNLDRQTGFTLLELIVVMVIVGILATQVIFALTSDVTKVKGAAFQMRSDFNLARSEAVNRNQDVIVTFQKGAVDGYRLWIDDDPAGGPGFYTAGADTLIKEMTFDGRVQFYDTATVNGPPFDGAVSGEATNPDGGSDGVSFGADNFTMENEGTSNKNGTVYLYVPDSANPAVFAAILGNNYRVRLVRWRTDLSAWSKK
jgi:prepilin-type N-terminal cleavage/methylation domain-containing protein